MPKESFNPMTFGGKEGMMILQKKSTNMVLGDQSFNNPSLLA